MVGKGGTDPWLIALKVTLRDRVSVDVGVGMPALSLSKFHVKGFQNIFSMNLKPLLIAYVQGIFQIYRELSNNQKVNPFFNTWYKKINILKRSFFPDTV